MSKRLTHTEHGRATRTVTIAPYNKGEGPTFTLHLFPLEGGGALAYELWSRDGNKRIRLFAGEDNSTMFKNVTCDQNISLLVGMLTAPRGEKDLVTASPAQRDFLKKHAENLYLESYTRFRAPYRADVPKPIVEKASANDATFVRTGHKVYDVHEGIHH